MITRLIGSLAIILSALVPASVRADGEEGVAFVGADEAQKLQLAARRVVFIDVRSPAEFQEARIRGAVNVPLTEIERRFAEIPRQPLVVLY